MKSNKLKPKDDEVVIGEEEDKSHNFICTYCNCVLSRLQDSGHNNTMLWCSRCQISFNKQDDNLRHEPKLQTQDRDEETLVTSIDYNMADEVEIRHYVPMRGGFAAISKKGTIHFTSYHTTERQ